MKKYLVVFILLFAFCAQAQHTISGTFSPADKYKFLLAYRLKPGSQSFIANTTIKDGKFSLNIPENAKAGMYRLVYAVPQDEFYFDVIYNGKEDVELAFDATQGVSFISSEENKIMTSYFQNIGSLVSQLVNFYIEGNSDKNEFRECADQLRSTQKAYEKQSENLMVQNFIFANRPYIPSNFESVQDYINHKKEHYFDHLKVDNSVLQASDFLTDKLKNYVFTALPAEPVSSEETEKLIQANIKKVNNKLSPVADAYKFDVFYNLWKMSINGGLNETTDFIYDSYLKSLATSSNDPNKAQELASQHRLRIGAKAPELEWKTGNKQNKLSALNGFENYLLVFWSSTCSHCLKELPELHKELNKYNNIKVIAVGLEDNEDTWIPESAKLPNFEHAIALGRWESKYARTYDIRQTPTYFLLDSDKRIIAKPENDKEVIELLRK
ncbi:TlpA family protein disulfide reductase [Zobellia uliginosa]|uniref:TlpA family protein disulfide reductase n=1 Tax=Zobellia uliginosa TaxID=143224 RepID=UPI001C07ABA2|nr:TlpA disulfide reductase family protein [Zobellia uliginosa]MBU2948604.1 TlpA family protein disulfide reductase [Zobellia uliginosa]